MTPSVAPVLVAGAGPSGLVAALTLLQNHVPVRIVDKERRFAIGQRGSGIWPRTFEVFHFLRAREIHERAVPVLPMQEYKPGTLEPAQSVFVIPRHDPTPSIPYNNPMIVGQPTLEGILRAHLERYGCSVELGTELRSFEDDGERVLAKLVKSKDGEETSETFEASFLVGADGARGATRKQLGLTFLGETRQDFSCVVGDICLEIEGVDRERRHMLGDRSSNFFSLRPSDEIGPDGFQFMLTIREHDPKQLIADEKLMFKCMSELIGREVKVRKVVFMSEYRPNIRMVDKFGVGRAFVAGDAAHVHSPAGGQGLNTCVQDAFNLAWKLSLVYKGLSPLALLDSYSAERLPVVAEMLDITTGELNKIRNPSKPDRATDRLNMLGVNYRTSPIVLDEFTRAEPASAYGVLDESVLVAGDRAPDAPALAVVGSRAGTEMETETRLFDVFGPTYHTVLAFAPDEASSTDVLEALRKYPRDAIRLAIVLPQGSEVLNGARAEAAAVVVVDRGGHAYRAYLAASGESKVVVVRPDGVVGAVVRGAKGVGNYFSEIFVCH